MRVQIDPEFRNLIPPLTQEEQKQLDENVRRDGCRDALVTWCGLLLDGHNRYEICMRFAIPFATVAMDSLLQSRDDAKAWIIQNQMGRRNLTSFQKAELVLKLEPLIAAKAKMNQRWSRGAGKKGSQKSVNLSPPIDTQKELARLSGLSHDTIHKARVIAKNASGETKEALRRGDTSINDAYQRVLVNFVGKSKGPSVQKINVRVEKPPVLDLGVDLYGRFSAVCTRQRKDGNEVGRQLIREYVDKFERKSKKK